MNAYTVNVSTETMSKKRGITVSNAVAALVFSASCASIWCAAMAGMLWLFDVLVH